MKYKTTLSLVLIIVFVAAIVFLTKWHKTEAPVPVDQNPGTQTVEPVAATPIMVPLDHDSYLATVSGAYPKFSQTDDAFNKKIADVVTNDISEFMKSVSADYEAHLKIDGDSFQKEFEKGGMYYFNVVSTVTQSDTTTASVVIREEWYRGGAHPFHNVFTFNYDVKNKKELSLTDVYPHSVADVSVTVRTQLTAKFKKDGNFDVSMKGMLDDGTDPANPDNFKAFTLTPTTITLYFGEYQVAPYVFGEQTVILKR